MKFPDDVQKALKRRFKNRHREWLEAIGSTEQPEERVWPLGVTLGVPTENQALKQVEDVRAWVAAWQSWRGVGSLSWSDRRWRKLGVQRLPERRVSAGGGVMTAETNPSLSWQLATRRTRADVAAAKQPNTPVE